MAAALLRAAAFCLYESGLRIKTISAEFVKSSADMFFAAEAAVWGSLFADELDDLAVTFFVRMQSVSEAALVDLAVAAHKRAAVIYEGNTQRLECLGYGLVGRSDALLHIAAREYGHHLELGIGLTIAYGLDKVHHAASYLGIVITP